MRFVSLTALAMLAAAALPVAPALAANADQPHANVDRSNDAGNSTGDSQVERLNNAQMPGNYHGQNPAPAAPASPPPAADGSRR